MSEWYDNKKNPNSDWRNTLQEKFHKNKRKRGKLTTEEQQLLTKIEGIADTLRRGENVQNRQLQRWLTDDEYEQIELEWDAQKSFR